jgi:hypothetical protein
MDKFIYTLVLLKNDVNKIKFEIESLDHASPKMLYQYFGTPSGLQWFVDNVNSMVRYILLYGWIRRTSQSLTRKTRRKK